MEGPLASQSVGVADDFLDAVLFTSTSPLKHSLSSGRKEETEHSNYNHFSILQWNGNCIAWTRRAFARLRQLSLCSSNGTHGRMQIAPSVKEAARAAPHRCSDRQSVVEDGA